MKVYTSKSLSHTDREVIQAVFGSDKKIEWLVVSSRPVVDPNSALTELDYINNPDGTIRWIYPARSRRPLFLSTYNSPTKKAALYRKGIATLFWFGLARIARSGKMLIQHLPEAGIAALPVSVSGQDYAVFTGTPGPNRKAVIALADHGEVLDFAKVAIGSQAADRMQHEVRALETIAGLGLRNWRIPTGSSLGPETTLQENIAAKSTARSAQLSDVHLRALGEMASATLSYSSTLRNAFLKRIQLRLCSIEEGPTLPGMNRLVAQLKTLYAGASTIKKIPFTYAHGDFTPWNLYPVKNRLRVYDWEMASHLPAMFDCLHFVFQNAVLVTRKTYAGIREELGKIFLRNSMRLLVHKAGLDLHELVQLYLLETVSAYLCLFQEQGDLHPQAWWLMQTWSQALESECGEIDAPACRSQFLEELPTALQSAEYAVMRGGENGLASLPVASDLDLLVTVDTRDKLLDLAAQHPLVLKHRRFRQSFMDRLELHFVDGSFLSLDLLTDLKRKSLRMMSATDLLERATTDGHGINRLLVEDQLEYAILFYGVNRSLLPEKYCQMFLGLSLPRRNAFAERLQQVFNLPASSLHLQRYSENSGKRLRDRLRSLPINHRLLRPRLSFQYLTDLFRRLVWENGMVITFSGVDGAGKSTVLEATAEAVGHAYRRKVKVLRHRPSILPILSAFRHGKKAAESRSAAKLPRQGTNRNLFSSLFRFAWYYTDYLFGQWYIWLRYQRRGYVVLYDRYYFDMIADPERSNFRLPSWLVRLAGKLIRKPELNFLLTADPEAIRARKQELPLNDIRSLTDRYRQLFQDLSQADSRAKYVSLHNLCIEESVDRVIRAYRKAL